MVFENEYSAQFFNSAWRQFRKRNAYPTAITQNVEYLLDSVQASTMLSNSEFIVMLNQAAPDRADLARLLNISNEQMSYITNAAQILQIPETIGSRSKEGLSLHLLSKSRADAKIVSAFVFDRISVNGIPVECSCSYCIYIREETDPTNVHCGRQKVHYPQILDYEDEEICINNNVVIKAVSSVLHDYAFIVQAFEYDTETGYLNFDALIVGENGVPYSKVFVIKRGVGEKFSEIFNEYADIYDSEIIAMRSKLGYDQVSPDNFMEIMNSNKELAISIVEDQLLKDNDKEYYVLSRQYPYSMYDIEVKQGEKKNFLVLRFTSTKIKYFNLSSNTIRFINDFSENTQLILITDINGSPQCHVFSSKEISAMKKTINSVTYEQRGV